MSRHLNLLTGQPPGAGRLTCQKYFEGWLIGHNVGPRTGIRYEQLLRIHFYPQLGAVKLTELTSAHLQSLYNQRRLVIDPVTVRQLHAVIHRGLHDAVGIYRVVNSNVADYVSVEIRRKAPMPILTVQQTSLLIESVKGDPLEALWVLLATSGCRLGEALGLKWSDVHLDKGSIRVARSAQRVTRQGIKFLEPKTDAGFRDVPLPPMTVDSLSRHRTRQAKERTRVEELVFCTSTGRAWENSNLLSRQWYPLLDRLGLPRVRIHDLRHGHATHLRESGLVAIESIAHRLGHSSPAVTLKIYAHVTGQMQAEAAQVTERLLTVDRVADATPTATPEGLSG